MFYNISVLVLLFICVQIHVSQNQRIGICREEQGCIQNDFIKSKKLDAVEKTLEYTELKLREKTMHNEYLRNVHEEVTAMLHQQYAGCREALLLKVRQYEEMLTLLGSRYQANDSTINGICYSHPKLVIADPNTCRLYYNCSETTYNQECKFPFYFSEKTLRCENYTEVECKSRKESKWECDYTNRGGGCQRAHCGSPGCYVTFPRCDDKEDGMWPQDAKPGSPYFVICKDGRRISEGYCPKDQTWNSVAFPYNGTCTSIFLVPKALGGSLPSCDGKADGKYRYIQRPCDAFYECINGTTTGAKCPENTIFDVNSKVCKSGITCSV